MTRRHRIILTLGIVATVAGAIAIQFIPVKLNYNDQPVVQEPNWDSETTRQLSKRACFDCHAYETEWPWYSEIAPVSWVLQHSVSNGLDAMNYSDWEGVDLDYLIELVTKEQMPPGYYLILHPEARLSSVEESQLIYGMIETVQMTDVAKKEESTAEAAKVGR